MKPKPERLALLTLNVLGVPFARHTRARFETLAREVSALDVDILCLQEVQYRGYTPLLRDLFPSHPYHAFEPFVHAPKGGLMLLSRRPIKRQRFVLYKKRGRITSPALADWILHKGILAANLEWGDLPVTIVNTHLVANYAADWSRENRYVRHQRAELNQLHALVEGIEPDHLVLVAGDFNIPPRAPIYRDFIRASGLHDLLGENSRPTYRPLQLLPARYQLALDHVLMRAPSPGIRAESQILFDEPLELVNGKRSHLSDHSGILAEIYLP